MASGSVLRATQHPKLAKDAGLIAAFQTNNLEALRKQKFADSLENAFISSAGDFYSVLNRMSAEPDFKRLLTEFALVEFKRGLETSHPSPLQVKPSHFSQSKGRALAIVHSRFGDAAVWSNAVEALYEQLTVSMRDYLSLSDVSAIEESKALSAATVIFPVLNLLSSDDVGILHRTFIEGEGAVERTLTFDEVRREAQKGAELAISSDWAERFAIRWSVAQGVVHG